MSSPASSPPEACDLAVVALSARALAGSAARAGLKALAIDLFADGDTREHAAKAARAAPSRRGMGFDGRSLLAALEAHAPAGLPVVLGAGFEHTPGLMRAIARRNPILGASPETVALLKNPFDLDALLTDLDIPHPAVLDSGAIAALHLSPAAAPAEVWISKRRGASGGGHIHVGGRGRGGQRYLQRIVPGRAVSTLFLADGVSARTVGHSEQWADPTPRSPYRYGGAVGPIALPPTLVEEIAGALDRIVARTGLVGLASADLIIQPGPKPAFKLLEINPRPGATLDLFDRDGAPPLLGLHLDACAGRLPDRPPAFGEIRAAAVVYADRAVSVAARLRPLWTADWPSCDETLHAGAPVCTVLAAAASPDAARSLVMERRSVLLMSLRAASPAPETVNTNSMVPA